jgi:hypothetical protein
MIGFTHDMLPQTIHTEIVAGKRLQYRDDDSAILTSGKRVNHVLHLILSLFVPLWYVLWLILGLTGGGVTTHLQREGNGVVQVTENRDKVPAWVFVLWVVIGTLYAVILFWIFTA